MQQRNIYWLEEIGQEYNDLVGKKSANLGEIKRVEGICVPPGFAISIGAYKKFARETGIDQEIVRYFKQAFIKGLSFTDLQQLQEASLGVRRIIESREVPEYLEQDIANHYSVPVTRSLVGESHVAKEMRRVEAVIGGEGNGGVMFPEVHIARDAAVGIALILQSLVESKMTSSDLFAALPQYTIVKEKIPLTGENVENIISQLRAEWDSTDLDTRDGLKRRMPSGWIQVRASNTEPILRVFAEAKSRDQARKYLDETITLINRITS